MKRFIVIHFNDLGKYPPAINLIEYLAHQNIFDEILVFSRTNFAIELPNVKFRNTRNFDKSNGLIRFLGYLYFYLKTFFTLVIYAPSKIIYYESLSFFPVFLYKKLFPKVTIFCHYHEYETTAQYNNSMKLNKLNHTLEKKSYPTFSWISHTNNYRLEFFLQDNPNVEKIISHVMPNYPPISWYLPIKKVNIDNCKVINIVYVGALSFKDMYLREFLLWVVEQNGKVKLSIYSMNITEDVKKFISSQDSHLVEFKGAISYFALPNILKNYHVGVILYKGNTLNYVYNEPNKFFEYYSCGLDVWFPKEMLAMNPNIETAKRPSVLQIDFHNMKPVENYLSTSTIWNQKVFSRENAFLAFHQVLIKD